VFISVYPWLEFFSLLGVQLPLFNFEKPSHWIAGSLRAIGSG